MKKLEVLKDKIVDTHNIDPSSIEITTNISRVKETRLVIITTASNNVLIKPDMCANNAIVYDVTVPRNTSESILEERKDVLVIDGGIIEMPMIDYGLVTMGLPGRRTYACQVEAMLLAMHDVRENFTGNVTLEQVNVVGELFEKHTSEFYIAPFSSFGVDLEKLV